MKLTEEDLKLYDECLLDDKQIRRKYNIPSNKYYTITLCPDNLRGTINIDINRVRRIGPEKISKSDQP